MIHKHICFLSFRDPYNIIHILLAWKMLKMKLLCRCWIFHNYTASLLPPSCSLLSPSLPSIHHHSSEFSTRTALNLDENGLTGYLTRFVASSLAWIPSDQEKESIWEAASRRLSERSGRMAMSSMSRTFTICDFAVKRGRAAPDISTSHSMNLL